MSASGSLAVILWTALALTLVGCHGEDDEEPIVVIEEGYQGRVLLGPVAGARVEVYALSRLTGSPVVVTATLEGETLDSAGRFFIPEDRITDRELYLIKVTGGRDVDPDDDGVRDPEPIDNQGTLHALLTAQQIRDQDFRVTVLSELLYQRLRYALAASYPLESVQAEIARHVPLLLRADVDRDGDLDHDDLSAWTPEDLEAAWLTEAHYRQLAGWIRSGQSIALEAAERGDILLGSLTLTGDDSLIGRMALAGPRAYLAAGNAGLRVVDVADGAAPTLIGALATEPYINALALSGDTLALAGRQQGLLVVDVADPTRPALVAEVATPGFATSVDFQGDRVVLLTDQSLVVLDLADPAAPSLLGRIELQTGGMSFNEQVLLSGSRAYVSSCTLGSPFHSVWSLRVVDLTVPTAPQVMGELYQSRCGSGSMAVIDGLLYLSQGHGLAVIDISHATAPTVVRTLTLPGGSPGVVTVTGNRAYLGTTRGIHVLDVAEPDEPRLLGTVPLPASPTALAANENRLFAASRDLYVLSSPPATTSPLRVGHLPIGDHRYQLLDSTVEANLALMLECHTISWSVADARLRIVDIARPTDPTELATVSLPALRTCTTEVVFADGFAYMGNSSSSVMVLDLRNPANPVERGVLENLDYPLSDLAVEARRLYLQDGSGLRVIDVSNPDHPRLLGNREMSADAIAVDDQLIFVARDRQLEVIDAASASTLHTLATLPLPGSVEALAVRDRQVYLAVEGTGLLVVDASSAQAPRIVATLPTPGQGRHLSVFRQQLHLYDDRAGLLVFDIGNRRQPRLIATAAAPYNTRSMAVSDAVIGFGNPAGLSLYRNVTDPIP